MLPKPPRSLPPDPAAIAEAVDVLWSAKRPLVVTGRGARGAGAALVRLLEATGALYLDTQESRGLVPADHPSCAAAVRAAAMSEADVVLLIGRKLDYQLGYGSPAVFPNARFIRMADTSGELVDNRRGRPECWLRRISRSMPWWRLPAIVSPRSTGRGPTGCAAVIANVRRRPASATSDL
jgi:acetolactate synthase I/II/III large subunit